MRTKDEQYRSCLSFTREVKSPHFIKGWGFRIKSEMTLVTEFFLNSNSGSESYSIIRLKDIRSLDVSIKL